MTTFNIQYLKKLFLTQIVPKCKEKKNFLVAVKMCPTTLSPTATKPCKK